MVVIGIVGRKGAGKDTCADYIRDNFNFKKLAFATGLKEMTSLKYSLQRDQFEKYKDCVDHRWGKTPRDMFKEIGMYMRESDPDYWVKHVSKKIKGGKYKNVVISDVRFENEDR